MQYCGICHRVQRCKLSTFRRRMFLNLSEDGTRCFEDDWSTLKMEAAGSSETLIPIYQYTRCHISEDGLVVMLATACLQM
jgi:hypothetical protein